MTNIIQQDAGTEHRLRAESLIATYPDIAPDDLADLLHYLRKEASALDCAAIASNEAIVEQYRQLCHDQYLDRLRPKAIALIGLVVASFIGALIWVGWFAEF